MGFVGRVHGRLGRAAFLRSTQPTVWRCLGLKNHCVVSGVEPVFPRIPGRAGQRVNTAGLELDAPSQGILEHHPVAHKAVQRVLEGGGAVLFEDEVADPGETITGQR